MFGLFNGGLNLGQLGGGGSGAGINKIQEQLNGIRGMLGHEQMHPGGGMFKQLNMEAPHGPTDSRNFQSFAAVSQPSLFSSQAMLPSNGLIDQRKLQQGYRSGTI